MFSTALYDLKEAPGHRWERNGKDRGWEDKNATFHCQLNAGMLIYGRF